MGENTEMTGWEQTPAERLQRNIRHTESEISDTVHTIERKLSPANLKKEALRKTKHYIFKSLADAIGFVQRRPVPVLLSGVGMVLMMTRKKKGRNRLKTASRMELAGTATRAFLSGAAGKSSKELPKSGKRLIWRGIATALGAAASSFWYRRQQQPRASRVERAAEMPRAGAYPGLNTQILEHPRP